MQITIQRFTLTKRHALTISRGTRAGSENLLVTVEHAGVTGIGEMAPISLGGISDTAEEALRALFRKEHTLDDEALAVARDLGQTNLLPEQYEVWWQQQTEAFLTSGMPFRFEFDADPWRLQDLEAYLRTAYSPALCAAFEMALHDWQGKWIGLPLWKLFGLNRDIIAPTSLTIGINPPEMVRERVQEIMHRTGAYALKVKLGSPDGIEADQAIFAAAQEAAIYPVRWRVDANGGWTVENARTMLRWLLDREVRFVEQPLPQGQEEDLPAVHADSPLPIFVDESVHFAADVPKVAAHVDGVNLKLMKCGGLREALRIIHVARAHNLQVMIGCMSESSLAITAASHLSPLADYVDLDSHLNLLSDPYTGATFENGRVVPTDRPGLGVEERLEERLPE
jgi:L-alanine-DL-glutamate epimerase-like enolase superfamily enzyme